MAVIDLGDVVERQRLALGDEVELAVFDAEVQLAKPLWVFPAACTTESGTSTALIAASCAGVSVAVMSLPSAS